MLTIPGKRSGYGKKVFIADKKKLQGSELILSFAKKEATFWEKVITVRKKMVTPEEKRLFLSEKLVIAVKKVIISFKKESSSKEK